MRFFLSLMLALASLSTARSSEVALGQPIREQTVPFYETLADEPVHIRLVVASHSRTMQSGDEVGRHYVQDLANGGLLGRDVGEAVYSAAQPVNGRTSVWTFTGHRVHTVYVWDMKLAGVTPVFVDGKGGTFKAVSVPIRAGESYPRRNGKPPQAAYLVDTWAGFGGLRIPRSAFTSSSEIFVCPPDRSTLYPSQAQATAGEFWGLKVEAGMERGQLQWILEHGMRRAGQRWIFLPFVQP